MRSSPPGSTNPGSEWRAFRALQFGYFAGSLYLDDVESLRSTLGDVAARADEPDVVAEYERQRAEARSAEGSPAHLQDKTTVSDGARALHGAFGRLPPR